MPSFRTGTVEAVAEEGAGLQVLDVRVGDAVRRAVLYPRFAAPASPGDRVVLNTTAVDLDLGSGGLDFVVWNLAVESYDARSGGHVMKLRYLPAQTDVLSIEAPESPDHTLLSDARSLSHMPVVAASLHSQLWPVVAALRSRRPDARIAYVMTDGGALEASFSRTARALRERGLLASVITAGHALGGDVEAVNVYSALLAARLVVRADVAIVGMGPGVVGTQTRFGTTAVELGTTVNATVALEGRPVVAVRMSSGDARERHHGVSHHVLTALEHVALSPADVPVPRGHQLPGHIAARHTVVEVDADSVLDELAREPAIEASHMGRTPAEDPLFFVAAGAAGYYAASLVG